MGILNTAEIRRRRKRMGLTQAEAARRAGWNSAVVWTDIETGKRDNPTIGTVAAVAKVLGCRVDSLLKKDL